MHNNGPRLHRLHSLSSALNETNRHVFHHRNTQVHKPDWRMARAAFQHSGRSFCHTSPKLMPATTTPNNTTVMSPRHLYQETFSRSRWGNKAVLRGRESPGPRVAERQHLQKTLQHSLLVTLGVGETYKLPRHCPRAKVGGCGDEGLV